MIVCQSQIFALFFFYLNDHFPMKSTPKFLTHRKTYPHKCKSRRLCLTQNKLITTNKSSRLRFHHCCCLEKCCPCRCQRYFDAKYRIKMILSTESIAAKSNMKSVQICSISTYYRCASIDLLCNTGAYNLQKITELPRNSCNCSNKYIRNSLSQKSGCDTVLYLLL